MNNKKLIVMVIAAVVLGGAAYVLSSGSKPAGAKLNGQAIFPKLELANVRSVELGDTLKLASGEKGWAAASYHGYPVDHAKLTESLLKLTELKVGQVARGTKLEKSADLVLRDGAGAELARLSLGEKHAKWGRGRYASFGGETVLVSDSLDAFDGDGKSFVETKIVDTPWISFNDVVEGLDEATLGFATGVVAKVTVAGDTNRVATVGNVVAGGTDRYFKLDNSAWVYTVPAYSVEKLLPKKEEAKKEDSPAVP
jgi:hypothetical protein